MTADRSVWVSVLALLLPPAAALIGVSLTLRAQRRLARDQRIHLDQQLLYIALSEWSSRAAHTAVELRDTGAASNPEDLLPAPDIWGRTLLLADNWVIETANEMSSYTRALRDRVVRGDLEPGAELEDLLSQVLRTAGNLRTVIRGTMGVPYTTWRDAGSVRKGPLRRLYELLRRLARRIWYIVWGW